jgi:hypothetical protein
VSDDRAGLLWLLLLLLLLPRSCSRRLWWINLSWASLE